MKLSIPRVKQSSPETITPSPHMCRGVSTKHTLLARKMSILIVVLQVPLHVLHQNAVFADDKIVSIDVPQTYSSDKSHSAPSPQIGPVHLDYPVFKVEDGLLFVDSASGRMSFHKPGRSLLSRSSGKRRGLVRELTGSRQLNVIILDSTGSKQAEFAVEPLQSISSDDNATLIIIHGNPLGQIARTTSVYVYDSSGSNLYSDISGAISRYYRVSPFTKTSFLLSAIMKGTSIVKVKEISTISRNPIWEYVLSEKQLPDVLVGSQASARIAVGSYPQATEEQGCIAFLRRDGSLIGDYRCPAGIYEKKVAFSSDGKLAAMIGADHLVAFEVNDDVRVLWKVQCSNLTDYWFRDVVFVPQTQSIVCSLSNHLEENHPRFLYRYTFDGDLVFQEEIGYEHFFRDEGPTVITTTTPGTYFVETRNDVMVYQVPKNK